MNKTATRPLKKSVASAPTEQRSIAADINALFDKYSIQMPSISRAVVSLIATAVVAGAIGYFGGTLLAFAIAGVVALTGSALLALLVYVLGVVAMIVGGWFASGYVSGFILSGDVDRCYEKCSTTVRSWFSRTKDNVEVAMAAAPRRARAA